MFAKVYTTSFSIFFLGFAHSAIACFPSPAALENRPKLEQILATHSTVFIGTVVDSGGRLRTRNRVTAKIKVEIPIRGDIVGIFEVPNGGGGDCTNGFEVGQRWFFSGTNVSSTYFDGSTVLVDEYGVQATGALGVAHEEIVKMFPEVLKLPSPSIVVKDYWAALRLSFFVCLAVIIVLALLAFFCLGWDVPKCAGHHWTRLDAAKRNWARAGQKPLYSWTNWDAFGLCRTVSALGHSQTFGEPDRMSAIPRKRTWISTVVMSAKGIFSDSCAAAVVLMKDASRVYDDGLARHGVGSTHGDHHIGAIVFVSWSLQERARCGALDLLWPEIGCRASAVQQTRCHAVDECLRR
jgi:hypothetical protein